MDSESVLGLTQYEITGISDQGGTVRISARYTGSIRCPDCDGVRLRNKGRYVRTVRHETWGMRHVFLILEACKWLCRACGRGFRQQFPGILKWQRATERFRRMIFFRHWDGISRRRLGQRERIGSATIERWFQQVLKQLAAERTSSLCPAVLGIDEHFFSRRHGYATTFCDLRNHRVHDVVLGRSAASLEGYFHSLEGKHLVRVV
jgi:transposase